MHDAVPVVLAALLVGSGAAGYATLQEEGAADPPSEPENVEIGSGGHVRVEVPVDVVLLGFDHSVAQELSQRLGKRASPTMASEDAYVLTAPTQLANRTTWEARRLPFTPVADYTVHRAPDGMARDLFRYLMSSPIQERPYPVYNGTAAEAWLAEHLPQYGFELDRDTPSLVLIHGREMLQDGHAYRYHYPNGYLQPVRAFGEREPLVALDVSARPDPWVVDGSYPPGPYDYTLAPGGSATVDALEEAVHNATAVRLLQGPGFPVPTGDCHAITVVLGIRSASLSERLEDYRAARELLDVQRLERSWSRVLDDEVHVDLKVLHLPQDDPGLSAMLRSYPGYEAQATWVAEHWERYWVPHEDCQGYATFAVEGDPATIWDAGYATYNGTLDARVAFTWTSDYLHLVDQYEGPAEDVVHSLSVQDNAGYDVMTSIVGHETGHAFGLLHSHNVFNGSNETDPSRNVPGFSSVWSAMSYHQTVHTAQLSVLDRITIQRARAGLLTHEAFEADLTEHPRFEEALDELDSHEWAKAAEILDELLEPSGGSAG